MLQWTGGLRRKVKEKTRQVQIKRQRQFFEHQRQQTFEGRQPLSRPPEIPAKSLDIISLQALACIGNSPQECPDSPQGRTNCARRSAREDDEEPNHRPFQGKRVDSSNICEKRIQPVATLSRLEPARPRERRLDHTEISLPEKLRQRPKEGPDESPRPSREHSLLPGGFSLVKLLEAQDKSKIGHELPSEPYVSFTMDGAGALDGRTPPQSPRNHTSPRRFFGFKSTPVELKNDLGHEEEIVFDHATQRNEWDQSLPSPKYRMLEERVEFPLGNTQHDLGEKCCFPSPGDTRATGMNHRSPKSPFFENLKASVQPYGVEAQESPWNESPVMESSKPWDNLSPVEVPKPSKQSLFLDSPKGCNESAKRLYGWMGNDEADKRSPSNLPTTVRSGRNSFLKSRDVTGCWKARTEEDALEWLQDLQDDTLQKGDQRSPRTLEANSSTNAPLSCSGYDNDRSIVAEAEKLHPFLNKEDDFQTVGSTCNRGHTQGPLEDDDNGDDSSEHSSSPNAYNKHINGQCAVVPSPTASEAAENGDLGVKGRNLQLAASRLGLQLPPQPSISVCEPPSESCALQIQPVLPLHSRFPGNPCSQVEASQPQWVCAIDTNMQPKFTVRTSSSKATGRILWTERNEKTKTRLVLLALHDEE